MRDGPRVTDTCEWHHFGSFFERSVRVWKTFEKKGGVGMCIPDVTTVVSSCLVKAKSISLYCLHQTVPRMEAFVFDGTVKVCGRYVVESLII